MWKLIKSNYRNYHKTIRGWLFDGELEECSYKVFIDNNNLLVFPTYKPKHLMVKKDEETYLEIPIQELITNKELINALKLLIEPHIKTDFNHRKIKKEMLRYLKSS